MLLNWFLKRIWDSKIAFQDNGWLIRDTVDFLRIIGLSYIFYEKKKLTDIGLFLFLNDTGLGLVSVFRILVIDCINQLPDQK